MGFVRRVREDDDLRWVVHDLDRVRKVLQPQDLWMTGYGVKEDDQRCTELSLGTGVRCRALAVQGLDVCTAHGGGTIQERVIGDLKALDLAVKLHQEWLDENEPDVPF